MLAFFVGIVLGIFYFGGLYLSIQKLNEVRYPGLLMFISFILRMALLLVTFFYIAKGTYKDILLTLFGVILVRIIMTFSMKDKKPKNEVIK